MKNVLITGSNGYIARNLACKLTECNITLLNREICDLTNTESVNDFFANKYFDVVIHTANVGGSRFVVDPPTTIQQNLLMVHNLLSQPIGRFMSIGSGAEVGYPKTQYGISKQLIHNLLELKSIKKYDVHNLRVYGVFNEDEVDTRFIKSSIFRYINKQSIIIDKDKTMDFIYMDDFVSIVQLMLEKWHPYLTECCYRDKYKLSDIAYIINTLDSYKVPIIIKDQSSIDNYYSKESDIWFEPIGLRRGITETYNKIVESQR